MLACKHCQFCTGSEGDEPSPHTQISLKIVKTGGASKIFVFRPPAYQKFAEDQAKQHRQP